MTKSPCLMTQHTMGYIFRFVWNRVRYPRIWWLFIILQWPFWGVYLVFRQTHFRLMINQSRDSVSLGNCAERGQSMTNLHQRKMASQNEKSHLKASCDVFYFIFSDGHHRWPSPSTLFWTQPCPESSFSHDVNGKAVETFLGRTRSTRSTIRVWRIQKFTCWPRIHLRKITDCLIATMFLLVIAVIIFYCILLSASSYLVQLCLYEYNSQNHRITSKSNTTTS